MRSTLNGLESNHTSLTAVRAAAVSAAAVLAAAGLLTARIANAGTALDFSSPAIAMSSEAVIASGVCIAKYAAALDDQSKSAAEIGQRVARRCAKQISRSAALATWMSGKPDDFARNLKYAQQDLTTNTVLRYRSSL
jgi:ATP-dependent protease ClpP protease subunit